MSKGQAVSRGENYRRRAQESTKQSRQKRGRGSAYGVGTAQAKRTASGRRRREQKKKASKKRIWITLIVILIIAVLGISGYFVCQYQEKSVAEDHVKKGVQLLQEERYEEAVIQFEKAIASEQARQEQGNTATLTEDGTPYITEAYRGLGMVNYVQQDYEQARMNLQQVIDLGGGVTPVLYNLIGLSAMYLEDYDGALSAFEAGAALPASGTYTDTSNEEQVVDYSAVIQEMKFNRIVCFEKKLDWVNAKAEMEAYIGTYPEDTAAQKEAEFLSTR